MTTIQNLIEHYPELIAILRQERIQRAILFKGFTFLERNNVNLYLEYADDDPEVSSTHEVNISRSLERQPFGFEVCITDRRSMNPIDLAKLDASNSVELSQEPKKFEMTRSQLSSVFGESWEFNVTLKLATRTGMEGFEEHTKEMELIRARFDERDEMTSYEDNSPSHIHTGRMF